MGAFNKDSATSIYRGSFQILSCLSTWLFLSVIFAANICLCEVPSSNPDLAFGNESKQIDYASYMKPIGDSDLFNQLDLKEYQDFNSSKLLEQLIRSAESHSTSPEEFHQELRALIKQTSGDLIQKYNVSVNQKAIDPYTITPLRLSLMFPHYYSRFYDEPIRDYMLAKTYCTLTEEAMRPIAMNHHEFGGLIPRNHDGKMLPTNIRDQIIKVHAYTLIFCEGKVLKSIYTVGRVLKERINKSLLSYEHRIRLLKKIGILTADEKLDPAIESLYLSIPESFRHALNSVILQASAW